MREGRTSEDREGPVLFSFWARPRTRESEAVTTPEHGAGGQGGGRSDPTRRLHRHGDLRLSGLNLHPRPQVAGAGPAARGGWEGRWGQTGGADCHRVGLCRVPVPRLLLVRARAPARPASLPPRAGDGAGRLAVAGADDAAPLGTTHWSGRTPPSLPCPTPLPGLCGCPAWTRAWALETGAPESGLGNAGLM